MLAFYAELQVAGLAEEVATFTCLVERSIDFTGLPSSDIRYRPIRATLTGLAAVPAFFAQWGGDSYMRRSGWLVIYEGDQVRWRLAFYAPGVYVTSCAFSPAATGRPPTSWT